MMADLKEQVPSYHELINPTLRALDELGGSGTNHELIEEIITDLNMPSEVADFPHGNGSQTELEYRAAWSRTYLKKAGLIENSGRAVWALTPEGKRAGEVDARVLVRDIRRRLREKRESREEKASEELDVGADEDAEDRSWRDELLEVLYAIEPVAFERLCQRILRESGFIEVEVTRRSGDGGIDGHGVVRIAELISFTVLFQSKRYRSNIGPDVVRDFRGAMIGRADKGLLITTGGFTRDARREATRDGAPPIDLIDGELLVEKLKDLELGVRTEMVEKVDINEEWFGSI